MFQSNKFLLSKVFISKLDEQQCDGDDDPKVTVSFECIVM
jgi:hypothetical protein